MQRHLARFDERRSVRPVFAIIFWTDPKPRATKPQSKLEFDLVPLNHSRISTHLKRGYGLSFDMNENRPNRQHGKELIKPEEFSIPNGQCPAAGSW